MPSLLTHKMLLASSDDNFIFFFSAISVGGCDPLFIFSALCSCSPLITTAEGVVAALASLSHATTYGGAAGRRMVECGKVCLCTFLKHIISFWCPAFNIVAKGKDSVSFKLNILSL